MTEGGKMKERNFWLYTVGMLVSFVGSGVQDIALPLFILDLTGSGTTMGTFVIITTAPRLILYPLAGVIGDRVNRKSIMVSMDFGRGAIILLLALLAAQDALTISLLFAVQFSVSLMNALFGTATSAMLPDIVKEEELTRANSIVEVVSSFSYIVGPLLGGVMYGLGGIEAAFLINGVSFLGSGVSELFIVYEQKTKKIEKIKEVANDLKEGIHFIRVHRGLYILLVFGLAMNLLIGPVLVVLIPYVMRVIINFSAEQYGMLQTSFMVGLLAGNLIIGTVLAKTKIEKILTRGCSAHVGVMFLFAALLFPQSLGALGHASWSLFLAVSFTFISIGVAAAFVNTPIDVEFQKLTPTEFRARVFSVSGVITQGMAPLGYGIMGVLLDRVPAHLIAFMMVLIELLVVLLFVSRYVREVSAEFEK